MVMLQCDIVTPEGTLFSAEAEMVVVPGQEGELGVLPRHAPIVAKLEVGETRVRVAANEWRRFATADGYFMVQHHPVDEGGRALVLVEGAVPAETIDVAAVQAAIEDARARIAAADSADTKGERFRAERDLAQAENQLRIAQSR
jgi:F-type H+-transporting ATPase subunit epsilon